MRRLFVTISASVGLAIAQLRHHRARTILAVAGVAFAVLSVTLLASAGMSAVDAGGQKYAATERDLWITGDTRLAPGSVGGLAGGLQDAHATAAEIEHRPNVRTAVPMFVQSVYVGTQPDDLRSIVGVGVPGDGLRVRTGRGRFFEGGDVHYANGTYAGPVTGEAVIDEQLAEALGVSVGDTLYVGGTTVSARETRVTVVGTTSAFSGFLGAPSVTLRLSELQRATGKTALDPATFIMVTLKDDAQLNHTQQALQTQYPEYQVRTNREQLRASLDSHARTIASGAVLGCLALGSGLALTANVLCLFVFHQRRALAAALAQGISTTTLVSVLAVQGLVIGLAGGGLGLLTTPVLIRLLNALLEQIGLSGVLALPRVVLALGAAVALGTSLLGAVVAGWRVATIAPLRQLR